MTRRGRRVKIAGELRRHRRRPSVRRSISGAKSKKKAKLFDVANVVRDVVRLYKSGTHRKGEAAFQTADSVRSDFTRYGNYVACP